MVLVGVFRVFLWFILPSC